MADYTDPGLAVKKLASNVKAKMASKIDGPSGKTGQLVYNATTKNWEAAPTGGGGELAVTETTTQGIYQIG